VENVIIKQGRYLSIQEKFWPNESKQPTWEIGFYGSFINGVMKYLIHEMLHRSGIHNELQVRELTERYHKEFHRNYSKLVRGELNL